MVEAIFDALIDSLKIFPFIFIIYAFMEAIESANSKNKIEKALSSDFAPIVASFTGVIPECGFSVMCAKLYDNGLIRVGTLISAFLATSDEGIIVLLSSGTEIGLILKLLVLKILFAIFIGELLNMLLRHFGKNHVCAKNDECLECGERQEKTVDKFLFHPFYHAAKTFIYLLVINILLSLIIYFIGEDNIFNGTGTYFTEPLIAGLIGLIPNCASSIILASAYTKGILGFAGLIAGLSANAGVGLLILFKNKRWKQNFIILSMLYVFGVLLGYISMLV